MKQRRAVLRRTGVLQGEATECGLACVATVLKLHGQAVSLHSLRVEFGPSPRGMTLAQLSAVLSEVGVDHLPVSAAPERIPSECGTFIAHWDHNHYVVVLRIDAKRVVLHDPAIGRCVVSREEFNLRFTGVAVLIEGVRLMPGRSVDDHLKARDLFVVPPGALSSVLFVVCIAGGIEAIAMALPFQAQLLIDRVPLWRGGISTAVLSVVIFGVLSLVQFVLGMGRSAGIAWIGSKVNIAWSSELLKRCLALPAEFFTRRSLGETLSRFSSMEAIQAALTATACEMVLSAIIGSVAFVVMWAYSVELAMIATLLSAVSLGLSIVGHMHLTPLQARAITTSAKQQTDLVETLRGVHAVKLANKEELRHSRYATLLIGAQAARMQVQQVTSNYQLGQTLSQNLRRVLVLAVGMLLISQNQLTLGSLVAFLAYADHVGAHLSMLASHLQELLLLRGHAERVDDIAGAKPECVRPREGQMLKAPSLEVVDVGFSYSKDQAQVLSCASFRLDYGECVAITGDSGAGKSTLFNILTGSLIPSSGAVLINGMNIHDFGLRNYREHIAVVSQEDMLFSGSIAENISFFDQNASMDRVIEAASYASIHQDIRAMPMGYDTPVGDMGSTLSGGQKQRVLIARALYRRPKLLFLDEASSSLDMRNAEAVDRAIRKMGITRIIVAHRRETISMADRVVEIRNGQLVELKRDRSIDMIV